MARPGPSPETKAKRAATLEARKQLREDGRMHVGDYVLFRLDEWNVVVAPRRTDDEALRRYYPDWPTALIAAATKTAKPDETRQIASVAKALKDLETHILAAVSRTRQ